MECLSGRRVFDGPPAVAGAARLSRDPAVPVALPGSWPTLLGAMTARDPGALPDRSSPARLTLERQAGHRDDRAGRATRGPRRDRPPTRAPHHRRVISADAHGGRAAILASDPARDRRGDAGGGGRGSSA